MSKKLLSRLWNDDQGALLAIEFLFMATILIIGIIVGLTAVRSAVNAELTELANAILALSQGYTISGVSGCFPETQGSATIDTPGLITGPTCINNAIPSPIDVLTCQ